MSLLSAVRVIDAQKHEIAMNSPTIWRTPLWISMLIYLVAFLLLFSKAVRAVHKISVTASTGIGIAGFITFQLVFLIFNR